MLSHEVGAIITMITDEMEQMVFVIDRDDCVVVANHKARRILGIVAGSGQEQLRSIFLVPSLYGLLAQQSLHYYWRGELEVDIPGGRRIFCGKAKYISGDKCVYNQLLLIGDIFPTPDEEPVVQDTINFSEGQFRKVYEIAATINSNLDFQNICHEITIKAAELVGADRSLLYSVEDAQIGVFASWNMSAAQVDLFRLVDMEHVVIKNCLRNMAPVLVPYYRDHPDWISEIYEGLVFDSFILFPLLAQKQLVGVLALFGNRPMQFDDKTLMLLQMISNQMAIAVLNAQVYSEIRNLNKHLEEEVHLKGNELRISELQLLRKSNEQEAIFNSITDILVVLDSSLRIIDINQTALHHYGMSDKKGILTRRFCDVSCHGKYCREAWNLHCQVANSHGDCDSCLLVGVFVSGKPNSIEIDINDRIYMTSMYPIFDEAGQVAKAVCLLKDVTLVKRRSGELVQSEKMQAVGQLAAGVAHEIRNPLGAISNYIYIVEDWFAQIEGQGFAVEEDIKQAFTAIKKLVERSETVIRGLLDFSREKPNEISTFFVKDVLDQILILVGKTAQKKKVVLEVLGIAPLKIKSDSNALQHILFNLLINAIDALPDGGQVTIVYGLEGEQFSLKVIDNGQGIRKEDLGKIYNPFYTTKAPHKGTGLGLYIAYNLVQQLSGKITVDSTPGVQTVFTVRLPQ